MKCLPAELQGWAVGGEACWAREQQAAVHPQLQDGCFVGQREGWLLQSLDSGARAGGWGEWFRPPFALWAPCQAWSAGGLCSQTLEGEGPLASGLRAMGFIRTGTMEPLSPSGPHQLPGRAWCERKKGHKQATLGPPGPTRAMAHRLCRGAGLKLQTVGGCRGVGAGGQRGLAHKGVGIPLGG